MFANNQCSLACSRLSVRRDGKKELAAGLKKRKTKQKKKTERGKGRVEWGGFRSVQPTNRLEPTICSHARRTRVKNEMVHLV